MEIFLVLLIAILIACIYIYSYIFNRGKECGKSELRSEFIKKDIEIKEFLKNRDKAVFEYNKIISDSKYILEKKLELDKVIAKLDKGILKLEKRRRQLSSLNYKLRKSAKDLIGEVKLNRSELTVLSEEILRLNNFINAKMPEYYELKSNIQSLRNEYNMIINHQEKFKIEKNNLELRIKESNNLLHQIEEQSEFLAELSYQLGISYVHGRNWIAKMIADYMTANDEKISKYLKNKKQPAIKASEELKRINREKRDLINKLKILEFSLLAYQEKFPFLIEYEDEIINDEIQKLEEIEQIEKNKDIVRNYLSKDEYHKLSTTQRNQLALDRYLNGNLSKAQIGRLYERYIGWQYEQQGFRVEYHGIVKGFDDLGRDLICRKGNEIHIVQAKCWSERKQIRENHICQLFGTSSHFKQNKPNLNGIDIHMVLITSTELGDVARFMADALGVEYRENQKLDKSYPMIKCNINRNTGEKIYHLPFDQMYDKVVIEPEAGEMYVATVFEAESNGFRRAFKYRG